MMVNFPPTFAVPEGCLAIRLSYLMKGQSIIRSVEDLANQFRCRYGARWPDPGRRGYLPCSARA